MGVTFYNKRRANPDWTLCEADEHFPGYRITPDQPAAPLKRNSCPILHERFEFFDYNQYKFHNLNDYLEASSTDSFIVLREDEILYEEYISSRTGAHKCHMLQSISKSFIGYICYELIRLGILNADEYISEIVPLPYDNAYCDAKIAHLLNMTASLDFSEDYQDESAAYKLFEYVSGFYKNPPDSVPFAAETLNDFLQHMKKGPHPHGQRFLYASPNYSLLTLILEKTLDKSCADVVQDLLLPLIRPEYPCFLITDPTGHVVGDGGVCMTLRDCARFALHLLKSHAELSPLIERHNAAYMGEYGWSYTYGFMSRDSVLCHTGVYGQVMYVDFEARTLVVKFSSQPTSYDPILMDNDVCLAMAICDYLAQKETGSYRIS